MPRTQLPDPPLDQIDAFLVRHHRAERRHLEGPSVRLVPTGRGRFALQLGCSVTLVERP